MTEHFPVQSSVLKSPRNMRPLKCCLCLKPSNELPDYFKTVLGGVIQLFNKLQSHIFNGIKTEKLKLCKCCWIYFMRIHQLDHEVRLQEETCGARKTFLSSKIPRAQRSLVEEGNNVAICEDLALILKSSESQDNDDDDSNVIGLSLDEDSAEVVSCSFNSTADKSDNELLKSFVTTKITTTDSDRPASAISPKTKPTEATSDDRTNGESESESAPNVTNFASSEDKVLTEVTSSDRRDSDSEAVPTEVSSDDTRESDSEQAEPVKSIFNYENKWLPKSIKLPNFSYIVKQVSETDFLFMDKYPFQGTEFGFKCGLCRVVSTFTAFKRHSPWDNLRKHVKKWHMGDQDASRIKCTSQQRCIQVGPKRFQYGKYLFEEIDEMYQCGECGILKPPAKSAVHRTSNILKHILHHHNEKISKEYICEYCGVVYNKRGSLRYHKLTKHENHEGRFPCSECGKNFVSRSGAVSHRNRVHFNRREFICEGCGKRFSYKTKLESHVASVHRGEKLKCAECGKMFASQTALNVHRYCHNGKKYSCEICGMDFTQAYSVIRHKKTAHNE